MTPKTYTGWQDEQKAVEEALATLLPKLTHPHLSVPLGAKLAPVVGLPEPRVRKILGWIAKAGHPHATHDGGKIRVYGRDGMLWRWHPLPQETPKVGPIEARLNEAGVVDTRDW